MSDYGAPTGPRTENDRLFLYLRDRPTVPIAIASLAASRLLYSGPCIVAGWVIVEAAGAAAVWAAYDGGDATGTSFATFNFASGGASAIGPGPDGPFCRVGCFLARVSGTISGSVWLKI